MLELILILLVLLKEFIHFKYSTCLSFGISPSFEKNTLLKQYVGFPQINSSFLYVESNPRRN